MRLLAKLLITTMLFTLLCYGQSSDTQRTNGFYNGRIWAAIDADSKIAFLMGLKEGALQCRKELYSDAKKPLDTKASVLLSLFSANTTVAQMLDSLDKFYSAPANRPVPIVYAMTWAQSKASGVSEERLKEAEASLRSTYSK